MSGFLIICGGYAVVITVAVWLIVRIDRWLDDRARRRRMAPYVARWEAARLESGRKWQEVCDQHRAELNRIRRELGIEPKETT